MSFHDFRIAHIEAWPTSVRYDEKEQVWIAQRPGKRIGRGARDFKLGKAQPEQVFSTWIAAVDHARDSTPEEDAEEMRQELDYRLKQMGYANGVERKLPPSGPMAPVIAFPSSSLLE